MTQQVEETRHEPKEVAWGWMIAVVGGFMMGVSLAPLSMFGPLFSDVLGDRMETGGVETIMSVFFASQCFACLVASSMAKRFGSKACCSVASIIFCVGNLSSTFCPSFMYLLLSYGILIGSSTSCMVVVAALSLNDCFTRLRTVAFSLMQSVCMSVGMLYPLLMKELMQNYGNFGAQLILTAIGANVIPAALLLRPTPKSMIASSDPAHLLTQPGYIIMALGLTLVTLLDGFFFALLPLFLMNYRSLTLDDTTYILVAVGAGDFAGRFLLMLLGKFLANSNRLIYWAAATISATLIAVLTFVANFWIMASLCCGLGLFRGVIYVTSLLVYSEHYDKDLYYAALGTNGVIAGVVNLIAGYLLGLLRDSSGGYVVKFSVIVGVMFGCSLMWLLEAIVRSCRSSK